MVEVSIFGKLGFSLGVFVILLIVLHALFVWWRPLSDRTWKKTDYIWFGLTALSIVFASGEVRRTEAQNLLRAYQIQWETADRPLISSLTGFVNLSCNTKYTKADWMPQERWDEITKQQAETCEWMRTTQKLVDDETKKPKPQLTQDALPPSNQITEPPERASIELVRQQVMWYAQTMNEKGHLVEDAERNAAEFGLFGLWPLTLAFAFALRITRIAGELSPRAPFGRALE